MKENGIADTLYDSNWYALPIKFQLDIMRLMHAEQNGAKLAFGPFDIVHRELFMLASILSWFS